MCLFKAGDKVYFPSTTTKILELTETKNKEFIILRVNGSSVYFKSDGKDLRRRGIDLFHANKRNYRLIKELYGLDFEKPKSTLTPFNLIPFNLVEATAGKPVCTRDGRKARIICFDRKVQPNNQMVTLVQEKMVRNL